MSEANTSKKTVKKMSVEEKEAFYELCDYIKSEILEYGEDKKFPKNLALRIKGLREGKFIANNKVKSQGDYPYQTILLAFKLYKYDIKLGLKRNVGKIEKESHKINYIMAIIENKINDVAGLLEKKKKSIEKAESLTLNTEQGAEYKRKTKDRVNDRLKNLW